MNHHNFPVIKSITECSICLEPTSIIYLLDCNHQFHTECLNTWFQSQTTCPICRKEYKLLKIHGHTKILHGIQYLKQELSNQQVLDYEQKWKEIYQRFLSNDPYYFGIPTI